MEGPGTTRGLSYGLVLLPGMAQESSTPVPSFALGIINSAACLLAQALLNYTASMSCANTSGLMYLRDTFHSGQGCDSAFCLGVGKAGSMTGKTPSLMIQIKQICTPPSSLVKAHWGLGSVDEQSCWLRLLLRHHRYEVSWPRCVPVVINPYPLLCHSQIPSDQALQMALKSPRDEIRVGDPTKRSTMLVGGPACPHWVIFAHRRNRSLSKDLTVVLSWSWGEARWSTHSCFPDPLMQTVWVFVLEGGSASASHPHSRILSGVSPS